MDWSQRALQKKVERTTYKFTVRQPEDQPEAQCHHYSVFITAGSAVPKVFAEQEFRIFHGQCL